MGIPTPKGHWYIRRATNCWRIELKQEPRGGPKAKEGRASILPKDNEKGNKERKKKERKLKKEKEMKEGEK